LQAVDNNTGGLFFLDAPGGTGKTFIILLILATIRSRCVIAHLDQLLLPTTFRFLALIENVFPNISENYQNYAWLRCTKNNDAHTLNFTIQ